MGTKKQSNNAADWQVISEVFFDFCDITKGLFFNVFKKNRGKLGLLILDPEDHHLQPTVTTNQKHSSLLLSSATSYRVPPPADDPVLVHLMRSPPVNQSSCA